MTIVALDGRLADLVDLDARPERIATGFTFTEGPVWSSRDRSLIFSDLQLGEPEGGAVYRWTEAGGAQVWRQPSRNINGNTYDRQGRLISCVMGGRHVERTNLDGSVEVIASSYEGRPLNAPNDVICAPNGDVIFTDPFFPPRGQPLPADRPPACVFRIVADDGSLMLLTSDLEAPNGLALTPDGRHLYVDDSRRRNIRRFDVNPDGSLSDGRVFVEVKHGDATPLPDGMKLDELGNIYLAPNSPEGIWVYSPEGTLLGFIGMGESAANLAWGGDDWRTLFITARTSVYRLRMKVAGQPV